LLYDGQTYDQWCSRWRTELKVESRTEVIKALAAFAKAGYGRKAIVELFDVAEQYDFVVLGSSDRSPLDTFKHEVVSRALCVARSSGLDPGTEKLVRMSLLGILTSDDEELWVPALVALSHRVLGRALAFIGRNSLVQFAPNQQQMDKLLEPERFARMKELYQLGWQDEEARAFARALTKDKNTAGGFGGGGGDSKLPVCYCPFFGRLGKMPLNHSPAAQSHNRWRASGSVRCSDGPPQLLGPRKARERLPPGRL